MSWRFQWTSKAAKQYRRLDKSTQKQIDDWIKSHIYECNDPTDFGHRLKGSLVSLWRYRIGDYRLLCTFEHDKLVVLGLEIERRDTIYDSGRHKGRKY